MDLSQQALLLWQGGIIGISEQSLGLVPYGEDYYDTGRVDNDNDPPNKTVYIFAS